ncbi:MAG TPA: dihydrodipicolinate synthase family protein [Fimbriimonadaceae bacterium]|nr:dihydrodipicolinate synthase family protein [Fimbriimonadaceae bacterium]
MKPGVYPASVTPLDDRGRVDHLSLARLLAYFEAAECTGVVLAGTNGEGPSLSAVEKRDLVGVASKLRGKLDLVLGVATPSLEEAVWLSNRAEDGGAVAILVLPPFFIRPASDSGMRDWFLNLLDRSKVPVIAYNFPAKSGFTLTTGFLESIRDHEMLIGVKDSSGEVANLSDFRRVLPTHHSFVGDETLLWEALEQGWSGSISGAANTLPAWVSRVVRERDNAAFELILPLIREIRKFPQPAMHKAMLKLRGVLTTDKVRLPLEPVDEAQAVEFIERIKSVVG